MGNYLLKSIVLYILLIGMLLILKPNMFYYDNDCTKMKKWDLYKETNNLYDILNFHSIAILLALFCFSICK